MRHENLFLSIGKWVVDAKGWQSCARIPSNHVDRNQMVMMMVSPAIEALGGLVTEGAFNSTGYGKGLSEAVIVTVKGKVRAKPALLFFAASFPPPYDPVNRLITLSGRLSLPSHARHHLWKQEKRVFGGRT